MSKRERDVEVRRLQTIAVRAEALLNALGPHTAEIVSKVPQLWPDLALLTASLSTALDEYND